MPQEESIEQTINRLIDRYGTEILRICFLYVKDEQLAEDCFQEVFLKVFQHYNSFRHESSEKTWLIRITINTCKDFLRNYWFRNVNVMEPETFIQVADEQDDYLDRLSKQEIFQAILELDPKYKDVIILYYYEGYQIKEIAAILNTTTGTVSSLLSRARQALRKRLEDEVIR